MAEKRKNRKRKDAQSEGLLDDGKPTKEEYAIAKYMRHKLPEKKTMFSGHKVDYFIASRAIDCLLDSPWATSTKKQDAIFTTRESIVDYLDRMLQHKFFHRAKKIVVQRDLKKKKKDDETDKDKKETSKEKDKKHVTKEKDKKESTKEKESKELPKESKEKKDSPKVSKEKKESSVKEPKSKTKSKDESEKKTEEKKEDEKKKEKKKIKLDMHFEQFFVDGNEAYVWIYDPIPMRTWIIGMLMVIGAVLVCLFPLWPQTVRHYIYYLSIAAAFFLVFIIGLAIIRLIVFILIWALTIGKHHLWLLPNLTEDVGFFESFWPLYKYEYKGTQKDKKEEKRKKKKEKDSDAESGSEQEKKNEEEIQEDSEQGSDREENISDNADEEKNGDNGFEIVDPEEATAHNSN